MNNRITKLLNIDYPVISAAMNWVTSAEFVAAVSNAGGLGVLGPNAGQNMPASSLEQFSGNLKSEIRKVKQLTNKTFAVNYIFPHNEDESSPFTNALFDVLVEEQVKTVVAIGFKMIRSEVEKLKKHGFTILYRPINPTVQSSIEADQLGVDALIVTGREAGGHISQYDISTSSLVSQVTSVVSVPVIAAGGIVDGKGAKAVFAMGAEGVYMGTRFITALENPASITAKQAIINVNSEDFLELEGANERTIPTEAGKKAYELLKNGQKEEALKYYKDGIKIGILEGDLVNGTLSISPAAGGIKQINTCKEIIEEVAHSIS
ncbi:NAD(P)H-dependent flavin oxidoreductase [Paenibacillus sonchi]|uniref:NAD(P)H-dependent flavin oxidoreductase n=2 Tax=Paenibacillus sonchi TaxID=373687 RepID=UPI0002FE7758|nr:nitronate monooxygenase [Paenibacillus sonchi]